MRRDAFIPMLEPAGRLRGLDPYRPPARDARIDLRLDANEGPEPEVSLLEALRAVGPGHVRRYPSTSELEAVLAERLDVEPSRVVVTNGGDDAIDRLCRAVLEPGREMLVHTPTFEMIERGARLAGAEVRSIEWLDGGFPLAAFTDAIRQRTGLVALVSPNNPTGGVIPVGAMLEVARAARAAGSVVLADLAYVEFADSDPTGSLLDEGNVVIVRTFSKARGLAGLRVGYAIAPEPVARWLRSTGGPYPVSGVSLELARASVDAPSASGVFIERVRDERVRLSRLVRSLGCGVLESQANFVTLRPPNAGFLRRALAGYGIGIRELTACPGVRGLVRITLPGDRESFRRLVKALRIALRPQALLFDLDGVLADVSFSYRTAIIQTARSFGVTITADQVAAAKRAGNANNDWELTRCLIAEAGVEVPIEEVTRRFQSMYLGDGETPGLRERETLIPSADLLARLAERAPMSVVTGRPREEAEWFLDRAGVRGLFDDLICLEDAAPKPSAEPVVIALCRLGLERAWMVGDTPDDVVSASGAGVIPIGIAAPGDEGLSTAALTDAGAAMILDGLGELEGLLP